MDDDSQPLAVKDLTVDQVQTFIMGTAGLDLSNEVTDGSATLEVGSTSDPWSANLVQRPRHVRRTVNALAGADGDRAGGSPRIRFSS